MIKADVIIAEQRQIIEVPVDDKSDAIRVLWNTYGIGIDIKGWVDDDEVVKDEADSNESTDSNESNGTSGSTQGDILDDDEVVKDEQVDSAEPDYSDESDGTSGDPQGDILQTNE